MIFELSPPVLYELGLAAAVEWLCEQFKQRTGITVALQINDPSVSMSHELTVVVFQSVRELLMNIIKHARAKAVAITWKVEAELLTVIIEDDGIGLDVAGLNQRGASDGGFGLFSVRERLGLFSATLSVDSVPGKTQVVVGAPFDA